MMAKKISCVLILLVYVSIASSVTRQLHPDVGLSIKKLVPKYGYPFEQHTVTTEDGYILELHRIPHGKTTSNRSDKPAVLVLHGMLCSSDSWITLGPEKSLAYLLSDRGYDVWLGNHRGTTWSRKHVSLNPNVNKTKFWDYSYHEMGVYDNTAFIDYILNFTKQQKIFYIGHSQGTTSFYAMAAERPEYNNKIRLMVAMSPVTYTNGIKSPLINLLLPFKDDIWNIIQKYQLYGILKHNVFITLFAQVFCNDDAPTQGLCELLLSLIGGFNAPQSNKTKLPLIASSSPAGASYKQFAHYFQGFGTGDFRLYDYGQTKNLEKYGQKEPPKYNLSQVSVPVAIYYGNNDYLATEENVYRTAQALPNVVTNKLVPGFNHLDFMWAIDVVPLLLNDVLEIMERY